MEKINLMQKINEIKKPWAPIDALNFNDQVMRLALFQGEYHWHKHEKEDELFFVFEGEIIIELKGNKKIILQKGECIVIPKGIEHKPRSRGKSYVLLFEPRMLKSKGD